MGGACCSRPSSAHDGDMNEDHHAASAPSAGAGAQEQQRESRNKQEVAGEAPAYDNNRHHDHHPGSGGGGGGGGGRSRRPSSLYYFDAVADDEQHRQMVASWRDGFRGSAYFDALLEEAVEDCISVPQQQNGDPENVNTTGNSSSASLIAVEIEENASYPPASTANPYPPGAVTFEDHGRSMLMHHEEGEEDSNRQGALVAQQGESLANVKSQLERQPSHRRNGRGDGGVAGEDADGEANRGYPGALTESELDACLEFRATIKGMDDPAHLEMVLSLLPAEEEPYAICRFLRARDFDPEQVLAMMDGGPADMWRKKRAARNDPDAHVGGGGDGDAKPRIEPFFASCEDAVGHPQATFYTQFPWVYTGGLAKNGTLANYVKVGQGTTVDGIRCLVGDPLDAVLPNYFWYHMQSRVVRQVLEMQRRHPGRFVRCEETYIIDLEGLAMSQVSAAYVDAMKAMFSPNGCFPEVLSKVVILNAPGYFPILWRIVKVLLHPRTAAKVEVYSNSAAGHRRLQELLDPDYIPTDYGGQVLGLSFHEVAERNYLDGPGRGQIHRLMYPSGGNGKSLWSFALPEGEVAASIRVHTRSRSVTAAFAVTVGGRGGDEVVASFASDGGNPSGQPYSFEVARGLKGSGTYRISLRDDDRSHSGDAYLVIVSIFPSD